MTPDSKPTPQPGVDAHGYAVCDYCTWNGKVRKDGTMRAHRRKVRGGYGEQDLAAPRCTGSGQPPHVWKFEKATAEATQCGQKFVGGRRCILPAGHTEKKHRTETDPAPPAPVVYNPGDIVRTPAGLATVAGILRIAGEPDRVETEGGPTWGIDTVRHAYPDEIAARDSAGRES